MALCGVVHLIQRLLQQLVVCLQQDSEASKDTSSHYTKPIDLSEVDNHMSCARGARATHILAAAAAATATAARRI